MYEIDMTGLKIPWMPALTEPIDTMKHLWLSDFNVGIIYCNPVEFKQICLEEQNYE